MLLDELYGFNVDEDQYINGTSLQMQYMFRLSLDEPYKTYSNVLCAWTR